MSVFGILFWLWFTVSVVMLIRRVIQRRARPEASAPTSAGPGSPTVADATGGADEGAPVYDPGLTAADTEPTPEPAADTEPEAPADAEPTPEPAARPDLAAPTPPAATVRTPGIADALSGIRLPCDLAPLTIGTADLDPDHVDLVTTGVGPAQVADELGAELSRLGFEVDDLGAGEHLAHRDTTVVRVKVHDRPAVSIGVDGRGFPTAPPDGIVVELTVA